MITLTSEDKSHKWHGMRPIVNSCFLNVKTVITPKLFIFVLLNTSSMKFLCLSFRVGSFGIKRRASRLASSTEQYDTLRFCWKIFDYHMILTKQFDRNGGSVGSSFFSFVLLHWRMAHASRSPNACLRSSMRRKKITPVVQARQGVAWRSRLQVIS